MIKGVIFRYSADPYDPMMKDKESICSEEGCALRDPDFWINSVPVWGICGPWIRTSLNVGDLVFFVPIKKSWEKAGLNDYICTGILVVSQVLNDKKEVLDESRLTATYKRSWEKDLEIHLERDGREAPRTVNIRGKNYIIGDKTKSIWFGRNDKYLTKVLNDTGLSTHVRWRNRRIKDLYGNQAKKLHDALIT